MHVPPWSLAHDEGYHRAGTVVPIPADYSLTVRYPAIKTQPMIFDVMKANDKNDHDAADIVCDGCKSIIATLHGPSARINAGRTFTALATPSEEKRQ
jgi:hypothetical protein